MSGIPTNEAQERLDNDSTAICADSFFFFSFRGNVTFTVQSFVPMRDSSSHARRRMTPRANVGSHISRNISVSFTHRQE